MRDLFIPVHSLKLERATDTLVFLRIIEILYSNKISKRKYLLMMNLNMTKL